MVDWVDVFIGSGMSNNVGREVLKNTEFIKDSGMIDNKILWRTLKVAGSSLLLSIFMITWDSEA